MLPFPLPRFLSLLVIAGVIGLGCLAHGQSAAEPQQPPVTPDGQAGSVQPAQDAETANQIQQLQAAIDQLQQQVSRLTTAVEELQADRAASVKAAPIESAKSITAPRSKAKPAAAPRATVPVANPPVATAPETDEKTAPLTVLVFHDGHRTEARNYAIVGQTLWIYTEDDSKKVPLAELDVSATKNANSDRGIVFQVPNTK